MEKELRRYLEWRFRVNNHPKYLKYCNEWIDNLLPQNLWYYTIERKHLSDKGIYN